MRIIVSRAFLAALILLFFRFGQGTVHAEQVFNEDVLIEKGFPEFGPRLMVKNSGGYIPIPNLVLAVEGGLNYEGVGSINESWTLSTDPGSVYRKGFTISCDSDEFGQSEPFSIDAGAPSTTMHLTKIGNVGLGTSLPHRIGNFSGTGKFLTLSASGDNGSTGVANLVAQGNLGSQMHLVHNNAPANQRIIRFQCSTGLASFHVLNDNLISYGVQNALTIKMSNGNIGLRVAAPAHPLHLASGARCTAGGVWTNASSRTIKNNIRVITSEQARETVRALQPVVYRYNDEPDEDYVGFIAEDVPKFVATNDRKSLASMDIVGVLTRVVQDQEQRHDEQERTIAQQQQRLSAEQERNDRQQALLDALTKRLIELETKSK